jgi:hypothetical protein
MTLIDPGLTTPVRSTMCLFVVCRWSGHRSRTCLTPSDLLFSLSGRRDLNPRPQRPERCALPSCATSRNHQPTSAERDRDREVGGVLVGAAGEERGDGSAQPQRVDGLDDPAFGVGAAGEEDVGPAVEQLEHRDVGGAAGAGLEVEVERGGHAAHAADLGVEDDQVRLLGQDRRQHVGAVVQLPDGDAGVGEGGDDLFTDLGRIADHEHVGHARRVVPAAHG